MRNIISREIFILYIIPLILMLTVLVLYIGYFSPIYQYSQMHLIIFIVTVGVITVSMAIFTSFIMNIRTTMTKEIFRIEDKIKIINYKILDVFPDSKKYPELKTAINDFLKRSNFLKNVYIISDYRNEKALSAVITAIEDFKLSPVITKENVRFDLNLWDSIQVHMLCSKFIIVLITPSAKEYPGYVSESISPNLWLEFGFAQSLERDRKIYMLVEKNIKLPSDIQGKHYDEVDIDNTADIHNKVKNWLSKVALE
ncbi:MAG: nucleotide-binding protein [candidate division Zixibacteria bacterium]|nr:nucleotide-binding protein [Candidatus Tariuqbacter arcticus]